MYELMVESKFAAAHQLRGYKGKCENLHGHNWRVTVAVTAERLNEQGWRSTSTTSKRPSATCWTSSNTPS